MKRTGFQLFFHPEGAGSTAGALETKAGETKVEETKGTETKVEETQVGETKATETKVEETKAGETKTETAEEKATREAAATQKAPDKYELKVDEDAAVFIDADDLKLIEKLARDKGLSNDQAQSIVTDRTAALAAQSEAFRVVTEADPTYGGDKLEDTMKFSKIALDKLRPAGTPQGDAFRKILVKTGYGNNLAIVSLLADLGRSMAEDMPGGGQGGGDGQKTVADVLYGDAGKS